MICRNRRSSVRFNLRPWKKCVYIPNSQSLPRWMQLYHMINYSPQTITQYCPLKLFRWSISNNDVNKISQIILLSKIFSRRVLLRNCGSSMRETGAWVPGKWPWGLYVSHQSTWSSLVWAQQAQRSLVSYIWPLQITFQKLFGVGKIFFKKINMFVQEWWTKLIKSDRKDTYN